MNPLAPADLHQQRQAIAAEPRQHVAFLEAAREASLDAVNRYTYLRSPEADLAAALDAARTGQPASGPLAGLPVSVKDLFDVAGQTTSAGSAVLRDAAPASADGPAVARLRAAGGLIAGRTNMTEFAFSGVGINPHHGTPVNPADRQVERIPGGSSSGAAVSVATGAAAVGLGSDTGGSVRIPAALCGIVGFKGTARLVPTAGTLPLSTTLDTVGALTRSVRDAITVHEILAARQVTLTGRPLAGRRLGVPATWMLDDLQPAVAQAFEHSLKQLRQAGAQVQELPLGEIADLTAINASGGFSAAQSYAWHRRLLETRSGEYDHRVALRIQRGAQMSAADYLDLIEARKAWIARMESRMLGFDALLSPTVPLLAPPIAELARDDEAFFRVNGLLLRNTSVINMLDGCALSLPCHESASLPVGLMIWHGALHDDTVLDIALQIEAALAPLRR